MTQKNRLFLLEDITCRRGGRTIFRNFTLPGMAGDILHISGANGVGKTSILRLITGALKPTQGRVLWGEDLFPENFMRRAIFLPAEDRYLKVLETCGENLHFWAALAGLPADVVVPALAQMDIASLKNRSVATLSAGQRRRLSLARLFLQDVPLWLLDEPLNALDHEAQMLFSAALAHHISRGGTAVIAGHQPIAGARRIEIGGAL